MSDILLYAAGGLGLVISVVHGFLGERKVVGTIQAASPQAKRIMSAVMFLSGVYWFAASVILLLTPTHVPENLRTIIVIGVVAIYLSGCLGNLWATRGRHFGWVLLALAAGLAVTGL